ncbi:hypothetical protein ACFQFC_40305 [Amorphoplanes digitatis]|uniref:hypothetical protein n=1 Tax=Actinoplanes digitatis TaxID=1868 RepID=UPI00361BAB71
MALAVAGTAPGVCGMAVTVSWRCFSRFHGSGACTVSSACADVPGGRSTSCGWNSVRTRRSGSVAPRCRRTGALPPLEISAV